MDDLGLLWIIYRLISRYLRDITGRLGNYLLIVAHNHPSGVAEPSAADEAITIRLQSALELVGIRTLDHVIVGDMECVSVAERGLL